MPWLPWSRGDKPRDEKPIEKKPEPSPEIEVPEQLTSAWTNIKSSPYYASLSSSTLQSSLVPFGLGALVSLGSLVVHRRYFKRIRTGDWITPDYLAGRRWIKGKVLSVGDADNFRLYHTPGFGWRWPMKFRRIPTAPRNGHSTIHIRIAGADAPEASHFGRPAQPYSAEALQWLKAKVEGKRVYCRLVRRDQYSRIIAHVHLAPRLLPGTWHTGEPLALDMIRSGWATTYTQGGADYGKWGKEEFQRLEAEAKAAKRGMWEKGALAETPAEYKRRYAASGSGAPKADVEVAETSISTEQRPWWRRVFSSGSS